jgi:transcriptional regulator with XRE-family HTH domain
MSESPLGNSGPLARSPHPDPLTGRGDIGRRATARRKELGLSREKVAKRAGSAPSYIKYVEKGPATPGIGFLLRLADALETTVAELTGGTVDLPPGSGQAAHHPELLTLDLDECRALLGTHGVGRLGLTRQDDPAIIPVNYQITHGDVAFRTTPGTLPASAADQKVAFEVDHIDDALGQGWCVLIVGDARTVTEASAVSGLDATAHTMPWAGGHRDEWIAITPTRVTGRRIAVRSSPLPSADEGRPSQG